MVGLLCAGLLLAGCARLPSPTPRPQAAPVLAVASATPAAPASPAIPAQPAPADLELPSQRTLPTPTPYLPDLTPPPGGWIAYLTLEPANRLALASPDGTRRVVLDELGPVSGFSWSPDGQRLAVLQRGDWLALISLAGPGIVQVSDSVWSRPAPGCAWSRDGQTLAYIRRGPVGMNGAAEYSICLYDVATEQTAATPIRPKRFAEWGCVAGEAAPPLVPLLHGLEATLQVWDVAAGQVVAAFAHSDTGLQGNGAGHAALWMPDGRGLVFARMELDRAPVEVLQRWPVMDVVVRTSLYYPSSLALWQVGSGVAQTVLEAEARRRLWPEGWLPDGRLEVRVMEWARERYEPGEARGPEQVSYRYFRVAEGGGLEAVGTADVPWWAGGQLQARLGWPLDPMGELYRACVAPDGVTVALTQRCPGEAKGGCIALWQGEGEPVLLAEGHDPQWQPG